MLFQKVGKGTMIKTRPLKGIVPTVLTPLTKNQEIDAAGLTRLVEFLIEKKVGGFWALGTSSEDMNLTFVERVKVAQTIAEANAGKIPLILGAAFYAMKDILDFIKETGDLPIDAFHVMPYHPLISLERLDWFYRTIAENCPKPLWLYFSAKWSNPANPEFIAKLKDHPNITGVKHSSRHAIEITKITALADEDFQVATSVGGQFYQCLCLGSKAHITAWASALPEIYIRIDELFMTGKHDESFAEQRRLNGFFDAISGGAQKDNALESAETKYILSLRGICDEYVTPYYREVNHKEREKIRNALNECRFF